MDIQLLQFISLAITVGYMEFDFLKTYNANILKEKEELKSFKKNERDVKEYYDICNYILYEILSDFDKENYPALKCPELSFDKKEYIKIILQTHQTPQINLLLYKLTNYINPKHLTRLISNLQDLTIEYPKDIYFPPFYKPLGEYDVMLNTIYLYDDSLPILSHEFLHMASTIITKNYSFIGFCINGDENEKFFNGFNEGYTEVLNERIFESNFIGYQINYIICKLLETMFDDKTELEIAYFNNNIGVFVDKFLTYGTKEELTYILKQLDYFSNIPYTLNEQNELSEMIYQIISRKNEIDKMLKCEQIIKESQPTKQEHTNKDNYIKRLVKKFN